MSSLKFYYAPLFSLQKSGNLKFLAVPPKGRTLRKEEYDIWFALAKRNMWVGFNLPQRLQSDDIDILSLVLDEEDISEDEEDVYE
jgi:hypothetical protein